MVCFISAFDIHCKLQKYFTQREDIHAGRNCIAFPIIPSFGFTRFAKLLSFLPWKITDSEIFWYAKQIHIFGILALECL